jgi:hypothetical protein
VTDPQVTFVYFIQGLETGNIKIGFSRNPYERIAQLRTGSSENTAILGIMIGTTRDEAYLQTLFAAERINREWFRPTSRLLYFIETHKLSSKGLAELFAGRMVNEAEDNVNLPSCGDGSGDSRNRSTDG